VKRLETSLTSFTVLQLEHFEQLFRRRRKRSEAGHLAMSDLISNCSDRGNAAILARGAGKPAFVRARSFRITREES
jgi:hypothetical protein